MIQIEIIDSVIRVPALNAYCASLMPFLAHLDPTPAHITADTTASIGAVIMVISVINPKHTAINFALFI